MIPILNLGFKIAVLLKGKYLKNIIEIWLVEKLVAIGIYLCNCLYMN